MALPAQIDPSTAAPSAADKYNDLLQEAVKDMREADQVCHGTTFASTDEIEKTLQSLRKWHEDGESRFGPEAMDFLRGRGIAPKNKTERRIKELARVLNIRRASDDDKGGPGRSAPAAEPSPAAGPVSAPLGKPPSTQLVGHNAKGSSHETAIHHALPTPVSANHPQHGIGDRQSPAISPQSRPQPPSPRYTEPRAVNDGIASPSGPLDCPICRGAPLSCSHSYQLVRKMVQEGLHRATKRDKESALDWLLHAARRDEQEDGASLDAMIDDLTDNLESDSARGGSRAHRKSKSAGSIIPAALDAQRASESRVASLPLNLPDVTASYAHRQNKAAGALAGTAARPADLPSTIGGSDVSAMNGHVSAQSHAAAHEAAARDVPVAKRRSREERQWCKVCKSDGYWCIHRKEHEDPLPRSARLSALQHEGHYDVAMTSSPAQESFPEEAASKKRRRSGPQPKRAPPQLPLRGDSYRDSGVGLSSNDDDATVEDKREDDDRDEDILELLRAKRQKLSPSDRELNLYALCEPVTKDRLISYVVDFCMENRMAEAWFRANLRQTRTKSQANAGPELAQAVREQPPAPPVVPERQEPPPERPYMAGPMSICRVCNQTCPSNPREALGSCRFHPGELMRKAVGLGHETMLPIDSQERNWWLTGGCPEYITWACCGAIGSAPGCQRGNHVPAPLVPEQPNRVGEWVAARGAPGPLPPMHADILSNRILPRGTRVPTGPAASTYHPPPMHPVARPQGPPPTQPTRHSPPAPRPQTNGMRVEPMVIENLLHPAPSWSNGPRHTPSEVQEKAPRGHSNTQVLDTDFRSVPDFCPPTDNLEGNPNTVFTIESPYSNPVDLSTDPDRHLLHEAELVMASKLRMTCASYLCSKRRIFQGVIDKLAKGKEYRKIHAQQVCKIDARKARWLFSAFQQVGWFDPANFRAHLPEPPAASVPKESDDSDGLSSLGEDEARQSLPSVQNTPQMGVNGFQPVNAVVPGSAVATPTPPPTSGSMAAPRRNKTPASKRRWADTFAPTTDTTPDGERVTREVLQWRKKSDGRKEMTPTCPYPPSWGEADDIDRAMVRMKRREKRAWPDIFDWWCKKGRTSLKNASCLAVRYSIMKRKFEPIWLAEEAEEGLPGRAAAHGARPGSAAGAYRPLEAADRPPHLNGIIDRPGPMHAHTDEAGAGPSNAIVDAPLAGPPPAEPINSIVDAPRGDARVVEPASEVAVAAPPIDDGPATPASQQSVAKAPEKVGSIQPGHVISADLEPANREESEVQRPVEHEPADEMRTVQDKQPGHDADSGTQTQSGNSKERSNGMEQDNSIESSNGKKPDNSMEPSNDKEVGSNEAVDEGTKSGEGREPGEDAAPGNVQQSVDGEEPAQPNDATADPEASKAAPVADIEASPATPASEGSRSPTPVRIKTARKSAPSKGPILSTWVALNDSGKEVTVDEAASSPRSPWKSIKARGTRKSGPR